MLPTQKQNTGFPPCIALTVEFNPQAVYYQTVAQWIQERVDGVGEPQWVSDEERARAIAQETLWVCQWYPSTPIGSCELAASSFEALMAAVNA